MKRFAKRIWIDNREFQFSFSEVLRPNSSKYYVSVTEEGSNVTAFEMKQAGFRGDWTVCQPAPEWAVQTESTLAQFINEYLN